ncbi:MAG: PD40 domain-containing protein [Chloroflexi bacterium]|nr:PD40 domain-containing protein [Chloroflexota bacterium]
MPLPAAALAVLLNLALIIALVWFIWGPGAAGLRLLATQPPENSPSPTPSSTATPSPSLEPTLLSPTPPESEIESTAVPALDHQPGAYPGLMALAMSDGGYTHVFLYHPEALPFTRVTSGEWDDAAPTISPDGARIAFASNRGGDWDLFVLELLSGELIQLTDDDAYQAAPAWSADGAWLAYEQFVDGNLEIFIRPLDDSFAPIRLTFDPAADRAPTWHPDGDRLAFVSNAAGQDDIWLATLSRIGQPGFLTNLTKDTQNPQRAPAWAPDGESLAWVSQFEGHEAVFVSTVGQGNLAPRYIGPGGQVAWDPSGRYLLVDQRTPDQHFIAAIDVNSRRYIFPPTAIFGRLRGVSWGPDNLPGALPAPLQAIAAATVSAPWLADLQPGSGVPARQLVIQLDDLRAPHAGLNQLATQPFIALRERLKLETGWDVLGDLENAYVPITQPLPPYRDNDWLYTGRAIALHPTLIDLNWMVVVREDFGGQTYWRVFLKARQQDGSRGQPLTELPWDFRARFSGDTTDYEEGGARASEIPGGYWVDLTDLAREYGWDRLPALSNWQSYFPGARFNIFAVTAGLDWETAMLQIYPPEIFLKP